MSFISQFSHSSKIESTTKFLSSEGHQYPMLKNIQQTSLNQVKISSKMDKIADLPTELFNPYRLLILFNLYKMNFLSFSQLKELTKVASDGNLASHLRYLENQGLITVHKSFAGRYPKRFYELTGNGTATVDHLTLGLENILLALGKIVGNDK